MSESRHIPPDWRWGTFEGSRDFDRLTDRMLSFREKLEWLEEMEDLSERFRQSREAKAGSGERKAGDNNQ